jgi:gluconate 2-dehydrogenase gamma chain
MTSPPKIDIVSGRSAVIQIRISLCRSEAKNMAKREASRREFLVRTVVGAGAAAAVGASGALVQNAAAQSQMDHMEGVAPAAGAQHPSGSEHGAFFNHADAATIAAFTERLMPSDPGKPGAREADVLNYIDLALAGAYAELQDFYRHGLASLDAYCRGTYKESFVHLAPEKQDEVIAALESGKATGFDWPGAREFFVTLRTHTMEGMFADPPERRRSSLRRIWRVSRNSRARPLSVCNQSQKLRWGRDKPWPSKKQMS